MLRTNGLDKPKNIYVIVANYGSPYQLPSRTRWELVCYRRTMRQHLNRKPEPQTLQD